MTGAAGVPPGAPVVGGPLQGGTLVCVGGAPGAGKTTVGALVAAAGGCCLVDLDSVTTALVEAVAAADGAVADLDAPRFAALRDARYACLWSVVADNLRAGRSVVAVAPFTTEAADVVAWRALARARGATRVVLCWLDVSPEVAAARAAARGLPRDVAKATRRADAGGAAGSPGGHPASGGVDGEGLDVVLDGGLDPQAACAAVLGAV